MRFASTFVAAICAAVISAQGTNNAISITGSTLSVTAGQPLTISWTNPSSGTVTIKLQQDPITPDGGAVLASGIPASSLTATLQIPPAQDVNSHIYTIEIVDDTDPSNYNFSPSFGIQGATGTQTGVASGSVTVTASASSATGTSTDSTMVTGTSSTDSSTITSTESSSATATSSSSSDSSASNTSSDSSASTTSSEQSTSSTSSASATQSTSVPNSNSNGAGSLKIQAGLLAMAVGLVAAA